MLIRFPVITGLFLLMALPFYLHDHSAQAANTTSCKLSDIDISLRVPRGYELVESECPKVTYVNLPKRNRVLGFFVIEQPWLVTPDNNMSASEIVRGQIIVTLSKFDSVYAGTNYSAEHVDDVEDFPPSLLELGGTCGGIQARLPLAYQGMHGVEWRQGIICLVEFPPSGSKKWKLIQAFYLDMNYEDPNYVPRKKFGKTARKIFRSIVPEL